ncbi:MAG TPA: branched-chain amino acid ABC transporter substrate-binding protein, partial [Stellaceae bacterium]|nr:branched-chain amino acid ABC transporter substrate-binding protein [Stellaceae bacterium]
MGAANGAPPKPANAPKPSAPAPAPAAPSPAKEKDKDQDLVVGVAGPMSGPFAFIGEQMKRGAQQAVDDINAKGGVLGKKLKLVANDDGCDAQKASGVANQLVQQKATLVIGHFCSAASIAASSIYAQAGILQITPASVDPKLTEDAASKSWTNVFNIAGRTDVQGAVAGDYLAAKYKGKKVAVVDDASPYGKSLAEEAKKAMSKKGLKEAMSEEIAQGDKDFSALIDKLKKANVV